MPLRLALLTISDAGSRGERGDSSGDLIASWAKERGYVLAERALVPDETARIASQLATWCDNDKADLVITTGGTGLTARDVAPEATRAILMIHQLRTCSRSPIWSEAVSGRSRRRK